MHKKNTYNLITDNLISQITYDEFVHLREWIHDKRIGIVLTIEIRFDKVQYTVISEGAPFDINNNLK